MPYAIVINRAGTAWLVNLLFQPIARRSKRDPLRWVDPSFPGAEPGPAGSGLTILPLYRDDDAPWDRYEVLHAIEHFWALYKPDTLGRVVFKSTPPTRAEPAPPMDSRSGELSAA